MSTRAKIAEFGIIQKAFANAVVTFYVMNEDGGNSGVKATLYRQETGPATVENPQTLNEEGILRQDCYVEDALVGAITGINDRTERLIRKIKQNPLEYAMPITSAQVYSLNVDDVAADAAASAQQAAQSAADAAADAAQVDSDKDSVAANTVIVQNNTDLSEQYKDDAQAAAAAAQQALDAAPFRDSISITSAQSPFTLTNAHRGFFVSVDTTGGPVIIVMTVGSSLTEPYFVRIKKETGDVNLVTINLSGTDIFSDGTTSKTINGLGGIDLQLEKDTTPDSWKTALFGAGVGEEKFQIFTAGVDFTAGTTSTLTLTNAPVAATSAGLDIFFDGLNQNDWTYNPSNGVITFNEAIPLEVEKVKARWGTALAVGVPGDGTIGWIKLASGIIGVLSDIVGSVADKLVTAVALRQYVSPWVAYTPVFTGMGTPTSVSFMSRRVGDSLEVSGNFITGTPTNVEARVSIGYNGVSGNVTSRSGLPSISYAGQTVKNQSGSYHHFVLKEPGVSYMTFGRSGAIENGLNKVTGTGDFPSGYTYSLSALFPIQGW